jgi:2-polyprenyl-6-methoxyphenol hydroxylase-like FAD-dependent oxidoreductase
VHSNIRRLAFGPEDGFARGLGVYASIFTTPNFAGLDRSGLLYSAPGRTAGLFAAGGVDRAIAQLYFTAPTLRVDPHDTAGQREIVAAHFAGLGWQVPRLLAEMETASDFYFDTTSQIRMDTWSNGRVALIGDAGYAAGPGGNGTGNAVVAACVLAGELAAAHGDHRAAFGRYERRLRGYIAGGQKQAAGSQAFLAPATWNKIRQRNLFFKILPYLPIKGLISRAATKTATAITVPDYGPVPR